MCKDDSMRSCCECIQGVQGIAGPQGSQGVQGVPGSQGEAGQQGVQGVQGMQGIPGKDCDCQDSSSQCCGHYANVYASVPLIIGPYASPTDTVLFDAKNEVSLADFDISMMNVDGSIKFLRAGVYSLSWLLQARITPPIPDPVPSWSFGFWKNGVLVPGTVYSGFTQAPGDDACHSSSESIVKMAANDVLKLRNTSVSTVSLNPSITGSVFPITIASVIIKQVG